MALFISARRTWVALPASCERWFNGRSTSASTTPLPSASAVSAGDRTVAMVTCTTASPHTLISERPCCAAKLA